MVLMYPTVLPRAPYPLPIDHVEPFGRHQLPKEEYQQIPDYNPYDLEFDLNHYFQKICGIELSVVGTCPPMQVGPKRIAVTVRTHLGGNNCHETNYLMISVTSSLRPVGAHETCQPGKVIGLVFGHLNFKLIDGEHRCAEFMSSPIGWKGTVVPLRIMLIQEQFFDQKLAETFPFVVQPFISDPSITDVEWREITRHKIAEEEQCGIDARFLVSLFGKKLDPDPLHLSDRKAPVYHSPLFSPEPPLHHKCGIFQIHSIVCPYSMVCGATHQEGESKGGSFRYALVHFNPIESWSQRVPVISGNDEYMAIEYS
ncbi:hypothetical protein T439DRAFT_384438 [Meredithblackwellia eburnea MCA 4105]